MSNETNIVTKEVEVLNQYGVHARPAALLVKLAARFTCEIYLIHKDHSVSAKSIMGLLTIEGHHGAKIAIRAEGSDAQVAVDQISELFETKFGED